MIVVELALWLIRNALTNCGRFDCIQGRCFLRRMGKLRWGLDIDEDRVV